MAESNNKNWTREASLETASTSVPPTIVKAGANWDRETISSGDGDSEENNLEWSISNATVLPRGGEGGNTMTITETTAVTTTSENEEVASTSSRASSVTRKPASNAAAAPTRTIIANHGNIYHIKEPQKAQRKSVTATLATISAKPETTATINTTRTSVVRSTPSTPKQPSAATARLPTTTRFEGPVTSTPHNGYRSSTVNIQQSTSSSRRSSSVTRTVVKPSSPSSMLSAPMMPAPPTGTALSYPTPVRSLTPPPSSRPVGYTTSHSARASIMAPSDISYHNTRPEIRSAASTMNFQTPTSGASTPQQSRVQTPTPSQQRLAAPSAASSARVTMTTSATTRQTITATTTSSGMRGPAMTTPISSGRLASATPIGTTRISSSNTVSTGGGGGHMMSDGRMILKEEVIEHEIKVPRKVVVEETVERVVVIPEKITREEIVEDTQTVRERIVEVAKPIIKEKIIEVPSFEYVEKVIEVPEVIIQEKIKEVPRVEVVEQVTYVPKIIQREKIVEIPQVEIREHVVTKIVEVPEVREEVVIKEIPVPRYVDVPIPNIVDVEVVEEIQRNVPQPVEAVTTITYKAPKMKTRYEKVAIPIYAPRFVEVALPAEQLDEESKAIAEATTAQVAALAAHGYPSLCEIEQLAAQIKKFQPNFETDPNKIAQKWQDKIAQGDFQEGSH